MNIMRTKQIVSLAVIVAVLALGHASITLAWSTSIEEDGRRPELPAGCEHIGVDEGHIVAAHVYALGVQVYRWNGSAWMFVGPDATLYASKNYRGEVGSHYVGPTWESNSGSLVVGSSPVPCTPDANSIPW